MCPSSLGLEGRCFRHHGLSRVLTGIIRHIGEETGIVTDEYRIRHKVSCDTFFRSGIEPPLLRLNVFRIDQSFFFRVRWGISSLSLVSLICVDLPHRGRSIKEIPSTYKTDLNVS